MNELADLERRITEALERIDSGLDQLGPVAIEAPAPEPDPALQEALDAEKVVTAQLEERIKALRQNSEAKTRELEAQIETLRAEAEERVTEAQERSNVIKELRQVNQQMQDAIDKLRAANEEGVGEPHLINQSMVSEIQGLKKARDADRNELNTILATLKPLLKDHADA